PKPDGRHPNAEVGLDGGNPYRDIGVRVATRRWEEGHSETHNPLAATLGPGHPLCRVCREPLDASWEGDIARIACARCDEQVLYQVPGAAKKAWKAVVGVLADEHR